MTVDLWSTDAVVLENLIDRLEVQGIDRVDLRHGLPSDWPAGAARSLVRLNRGGQRRGSGCGPGRHGRHPSGP